MGSDRLTALAGTEAHQGVAAVVGPYPVVPLQRLTSGEKGPPLLLLLDGIQDPHNLGAIVRTALCAGAAGIVLPRDRSVGPTPAVSRVSAGALEHTALARVTNLARSIDSLKKAGFWIYGLVAAGGDSLFDCDLKGSLALVVGGEGKGLRRLVAERCDRIAAIPQRGPVGSLNASVAAAVALYEAYRQRSLPDLVD
jgi:23S rRNA (guanosine2251-2'-O)-methyltransferase